MPKRGLEYVWSPRNLLCGSIWGWGWARRTPLVIVNVPAYPLYNINLHSELAALAVIWTAQHRQIRRTDYSSVSQQKDPAIFSGLFIETQQSHSIANQSVQLYNCLFHGPHHCLTLMGMNAPGEEAPVHVTLKCLFLECGKMFIIKII